MASRLNEGFLVPTCVIGGSMNLRAKTRAYLRIQVPILCGIIFTTYMYDIILAHLFIDFSREIYVTIAW